MYVIKKPKFKINRKNVLPVILALSLVLLNSLINVKPKKQQTYAAGDIVFNATYFPDQKFRNALQLLWVFPGQTLTNEAIQKVTELYYNNSLSGKGITTLQGVEYLTNLQELDCSNNNLTTLNLSNNSLLRALICDFNKLTALDLSNNAELTTLSCGGNSLTTLDLSKNLALTKLYCNSTNLKNLDLSKNTKLTNLSCNSNNLTSLDLTKNPVLTNLTCDSTNLTNLDLSKNTKLAVLSCANNKITSFNLSNNPALTNLTCDSNNLTNLDLSNNRALTHLYCNGNSLTSLNLSNNAALFSLKCSSNNLTSLNLSNNTALRTLECNSNNLKNLDLGEKPEFILLNCSSNNLTTLNLSSCPKLDERYILDYSNQTSTADFSVSKDGTYIVDMKNVVGEANIGNVSVSDKSPTWAYDSSSGIMSYPKGSGAPVSLTYNYNVQKENFLPMDVTLTFVSVKFYPDVNDESSTFSGYLNSDKRIIKPADPTRPGYKFDGWYKSSDSGELFDFSTEVTEQNIKLYAKWTPYTATFHPMNGEPYFIVTQPNENGTVPRPMDPTRPGYKFDGWYTSPDGGATFDNKLNFYTEITDNMELYAKWVHWKEVPEIGVIVAASEDSFNYFLKDKGYTLDVTLENESSENYEGLISQLTKAVGNKIYGAKIIDINFTDKEGNRVGPITFGNNVEIYIKNPNGWNYDSMKAFYVTPDFAEVINMSNEIIDGVPYAHITTDHFSNYAIVNTELPLIGNNPGSSSENIPGSPSENIPNPPNENGFDSSIQRTGDNTLMVVYVLIGVLLSAGIVIILLKSKNKQDKK